MSATPLDILARHLVSLPASQDAAVRGRAVLRAVLLPEPLVVKQRSFVRELLRAAMRLGAVTTGGLLG